RQPAQLTASLCTSSPPTLENPNHHSNAQGYSQNVIEGDAQQKVGMLRPVRPIEAMQTNEEKRTRKKLQTLPSPCGPGSQKQETGGQANDAFHNSGSPVHGG